MQESTAEPPPQAIPVFLEITPELPPQAIPVFLDMPAAPPQANPAQAVCAVLNPVDAPAVASPPPDAAPLPEAIPVYLDIAPSALDALPTAAVVPEIQVVAVPAASAALHVQATPVLQAVPIVAEVAPAQLPALAPEEQTLPFSFVPEEPPPAVAPVSDRISSPKRMKRGQAGKVQVGLTLHYWKYLCQVLCILMFIVAIIFSSVEPLLGLLFLIGAYGLSLAVPLLGVIGSVYCAHVTYEQGRVLVLVSLGFDAAALFFFLLGMVGTVVGGVVALLAVLGLFLLGAFSLTSFILFMIVLRKLAYYFDDSATGDEAINAMIVYLISTVGSASVISASVVIALRSNVVFVAAIVVELVLGVLLVQVLFRILKVIDALRGQVRRR
jgi:hypothetical protein